MGMKAALAVAFVLALAAAFALGRQLERREFASVDAFREALAARDELERAHRISAFLRGLDPENLPDALRALEADNDAVTREEVRLLMLAWSRFDPAGAFAWARAWPTPWSNSLMTEAIYAWGLRDARAALREVEGLEDAKLQTRLEQSLVEGWLRSDDRIGASEYIAAIPNGRQRSRLSLALAAEILREGPEAVMRWAEGVPEDAPNDFKRGAFYQAAAVVARDDPRRAAAWFEANRTLPHSAGSLEVIARRWAEHEDPPALFAWLKELPSDGERAGETGDAVAAGFRIWLDHDPEQAEAWLSSALPDRDLDPAVVELVRARLLSSPASAVEWAVRIDDEAQRRRSTVRAARAWRRRDPEAAQAWLARSGLPEDLVQTILSGPASPDGERAAAPPGGARPAGRGARPAWR
jgi:hypothetical protein